MKAKPRLVIIAAPSGTGKTTLCNRLLKEIPELILSISSTTRAPRGAEKNGVDYFFISKDDFKKKISENRFAEYAEVHGNFYGTSKDFIERAFSEGKSLLLDIDVQGADELKKHYPDKTIRIFLAPPSMEELERRLRARGTDSEESIQKRLKNAADEIAQRLKFDHVVVNDDLETTYFQLAGIVLQAIRGVTVA